MMQNTLKQTQISTSGLGRHIATMPTDSIKFLHRKFGIPL